MQLFSPSMQVIEFFHFACTSEDINNLAHALMLKESMKNVMFPVMDKLIRALCTVAKDNAHIPMLSRTHGQVICQLWLGSYNKNLLGTVVFLVLWQSYMIYKYEETSALLGPLKDLMS